MPIVKIKNTTFIIDKSTKLHKKYDVFKVEGRKLKYVTSFGDIRYQHYFDKIGMYSYLNHYDLYRRRLYRLRHTENHTDVNKAGYWSWYWLW